MLKTESEAERRAEVLTESLRDFCDVARDAAAAVGVARSALLLQIASAERLLSDLDERDAESRRLSAEDTEVSMRMEER